MKNKLINLARVQEAEGTISGIFTATLIYANLVDYLARHLLENLRKMISINSYKQFNAGCYYDPSKRINISLGIICKELKEGFEFPDKNNFLDLLSKFNKERTKIMHNLMQMDVDINDENNEQLNKLKKDLHEISKMAEEILTKYIVIAQGVTNMWTTAHPQ
jgi:hypothetical protein